MDAYAEINRIYPECHQETKAVTHKTRGKGLFSRRLKSVNHLHHNGSNLVEGPLEVIGEAAYRLWERIRNFAEKVHRTLYPRHSRIVGTREDGRVTGYLTFSRRRDVHVPLHHMRLELWGRTRLGKWLKFSEGFTKPDGTFSLPFDMTAVHRYRVRGSLVFEIHHTGQFIFDNGRAIPQFELFEKRKIPKSSLTGMEYSLGHILLPYWEYRKDTDLPRVYIKDHDKEAPQRYKQGRIDAISEQFIPIELITRKHLREVRTDPEKVTLEVIQNAYPENLTLRMDREIPAITRSDAWFGIRMMNGMYASLFDKDPENPDLYWVHYHWSSYAHTDDYVFADVTLKFKLLENGYMAPVEIQLRGKLSKDDKDTRTWRSFTPTDGPKWEAAKRIARVSGGLATEIDRHFAETHLNTEEYAIAAYRNIRRNPVGALIFPHVKGVVLINHTADQILVSEKGYIPRATAITAEGTAARAKDILGTLDWKNWRPMTPLSDQHIYARIGNLYWNILNEFVSQFIREHEEEIKAHWYELLMFSNDLVRNSVPRFVCNWLKKNLGLDEQGHLPPTKCPWYSRAGRMDLNIDRPTDNGAEKALSILTQNEAFTEGVDSLGELQQLCAYVIWQATFGHFWSNSKQYDDIGEIRYNSLGIRHGDSPDGALGPESDDSISPDKTISTQMMWWSNMLSRTGYGFIMTNEDKDISPKLLTLLKAHEQEFADLGLDIYDLQSETNI